MRLRIWLAAFLALVMILTACSGLFGSRLDLEEADNGGEFVVERGSRVSIKLEGNPTTGYLWDLTECDQTILAQSSEVDYKSGSSLVGAGGIYTFDFKAVDSGKTRVKLIYHRPWETDIEPLNVFEVMIVVKD